MTLRARSWLGSGLAAAGLLAAAAGWALDRWTWLAAGLLSAVVGSMILVLAFRSAMRMFGTLRRDAAEVLRREIARVREETEPDGGSQESFFQEGRP
ncbi:MAG: hypothetical protein ACK44W_05485 [Planctomycetota bacterium]